MISLQLLIVLIAALELGPLAGLGISLAVVLTMLLTARAVFGWIAKTKARKMDTLLDRLEGIVEGTEAARLNDNTAALDPSILDTDSVASEEERLPGSLTKKAS